MRRTITAFICLFLASFALSADPTPGQNTIQKRKDSGSGFSFDSWTWTVGTLLGKYADGTVGPVTVGTNLTLTAGGTLNASSAGTPGGSNTQLQYNNASAFGGISGATSNGTIVTLTDPAVLNSITTSSATFTAFAGATTLLTLGGTGATATIVIPGTEAATGTAGVGALSVAGGLYAGGDAWINTIRVGLGGGLVASNTALGYQALLSNTTGAQNTGVGYQALRGVTTTSENTAIGNTALSTLSGGSGGNVAVGHEAGRRIASTANLTSATNSIFIGTGAKAGDNGQTNQIVIGYAADGQGSNTTVLGNSSTTATRIYGAVTGLGGFVGDVTGNLAGNVTGNVTGNLTGNVVGNLTGAAGADDIGTGGTGGALTAGGGNASGAFNGGAGGYINTSGATSGGGADGGAGGYINTSGGIVNPGGNIDTSNGGGSITTTAGGSLTMGTANLAGGAVAGTILTTTGSGASLTALNASNISSGTLDDARLSANVSLLGSSIALGSEVTGTLPIANGGTGGTTAATARVALLPSMATNSLKYLRVNVGETDYELSAVTWASLTGAPLITIGGSFTTVSGNSISLTATGATNLTLPTSGTLAILGANTFTAAQVVDGSADAVQLTLQGHSTQTSNILLIEKSDGTDLLTLSNAGAATIIGTLAAGSSNTVSGTNAIALGSSNTASGSYSFAAGLNNSVSVGYGVSLGYANTNSTSSGSLGNIVMGYSNYVVPGTNSSGNVVLGFGNYLTNTSQASLISGYGAFARHYNARLHAMGAWVYQDPAQFGETALWTATTDATPTEAFIDGTGGSKRFVLIDGQTYDVEIKIAARKSGGSQSATYWRRACIQRTGSTTALVSTVQTMGTDIEDDAAWDVTITADDTNESLKITVTGAAATNIHWVCRIDFTECMYTP